ncbi:hypothetical protein EYF80_013474 [Liparis tanakae]|uniref:Uncharacterized protein n=1 Tax=Liparis tanakae TaxID=230148 RepID=A0A4Z2IDZ2_9TELE|nr:hypothetical protein EYF80_013474 [Liparis tanakae]
MSESGTLPEGRSSSNTMDRHRSQLERQELQLQQKVQQLQLEAEQQLQPADRKSLENDLRRGHSPLTCARSIPFSAASFLASGLANTRPFLGAAGAAAAAAGAGAAAAGAAAWNIKPLLTQSICTSHLGI